MTFQEFEYEPSPSRGEGHPEGLFQGPFRPTNRSVQWGFSRNAEGLGTSSPGYASRVKRPKLGYLKQVRGEVKAKLEFWNSPRYLDQAHETQRRHFQPPPPAISPALASRLEAQAIATGSILPSWATIPLSARQWLRPGASTRLTLGTGIALAFPRGPVPLAYVAHDLNTASWRQFRAWAGAAGEDPYRAAVRHGSGASPVARLRETVLAIRAVWQCWADNGDPLSFQGRFLQAQR